MQTFRELRERDCYYVDKTAYIERLLHEGKHYFLSRYDKPILDALEEPEVARANRDYLRGLYG